MQPDRCGPLEQDRPRQPVSVYPDHDDGLVGPVRQRRFDDLRFDRRLQALEATVHYLLYGVRLDADEAVFLRAVGYAHNDETPVRVGHRRYGLD
jgi:hypothetical protein